MGASEKVAAALDSAVYAVGEWVLYHGTRWRITRLRDERDTEGVPYVMAELVNETGRATDMAETTWLRKTTQKTKKVKAE